MGIAHKCDQFIININSDNKHYPTLDLSRGIGLTKGEVNIAVDNKAFSSSIAKISNSSELKFMTFDNALNDLIDYSEVTALCFSILNINKESGNLTLEARAEYEGAENVCILGKIDLISGEKNTLDVPCYIEVV